MKVKFIVPGNIDTPTGGYRYDREIMRQWRNSDIDFDLVSLAGSFPFPTEKEVGNCLSQVDTIAAADIAVIDGLAGGVLPELIAKVSDIIPIVALVHHPLCLENGLSKNVAKKLKENEQRGLELAKHIIATSPATSETVSRLFDIKAENVSAVLPGVDRGTISREPTDGTVNLLCVGSVIERKGHQTLIEALANLSDLDWNLDCIGSTDFDPELFEKLKILASSYGVSSRVNFHSSVSEQEIENAYAEADVFVLASLYEGYGMAYAEAIVRGLPVIGTTAGAIPDTVPAKCGILVEPGNPKELQTALASMIKDRQLRSRYRSEAIKAEPTFPTWENSAVEFADILRRQI